MVVGIPVGGSCPKGSLAEDGTVPDIYPMIELESRSYSSRTEQNVIDSDGTLILNRGKLLGGTLHTVEYAQKYARPCLIVRLDAECDSATVTRWIADEKIRVLNISGPRGTKFPGIHEKALAFLREVFAES